MVVAYHLIWTAYGFWLPNDIRGSMSRVLRNDLLTELGDIHLGRNRVQPCRAALREFFDHAQDVLKHPVIEFDDRGMTVVAEALGNVIRERGYTCYACAVMPDHVHILIRKHRDRAEEMLGHFQRESHLLLRERQLRAMEHPVWGGKGWKVFLEDATDIRRTIGYVDDNPIKIRRPRQHWDFITPYDGWAGKWRRLPTPRR